MHRNLDAPLFRFSADFTNLWIGQTVSQIGSFLGALGLLAVLTLDATPAQMGILTTLLAAPNLIIGLFAGVWVDRLRQRPLLIWADIGRALLLGSIVLIVFFGTLRIEVLYGVAFLVGCLTVLFDIAYRSYLPALVPRAYLVRANSRLSASESVAEIGAPGLGGLLVQFIGAPALLFVDTCSFLVSATFIRAIRTPEQVETSPTGESPNTWREIQNGLQLVGQHPVLRALVCASATRSFFGGFFAALYALYVLRDIGLSPVSLGILVGAGGIGALVAALTVERIVASIGQGRVLIAGLFTSSALALLVPFAVWQPVTTAFVLLFINQLLGDLFLSCFFIAEMSVRQEMTPQHALGRVNASFEFIVSGIGMGGIFTGGLLGGWIGMSAALALAGIGSILAVLWLYFSPIRSM